MALPPDRGSKCTGKTPFPPRGRHPSCLGEDTLPASGKTLFPPRGRHPSRLEEREFDVRIKSAVCLRKPHNGQNVFGNACGAPRKYQILSFSVCGAPRKRQIFSFGICGNPASVKFSVLMLAGRPASTKFSVLAFAGHPASPVGNALAFAGAPAKTFPRRKASLILTSNSRRGRHPSCLGEDTLPASGKTPFPMSTHCE